MAEEQRPDPNEKLVKVFDSEQRSRRGGEGVAGFGGDESDLKSEALCRTVSGWRDGYMVREEMQGKRGV